jgi:hypothetical protein
MQIPDFDDLDELLFGDESVPDEMILLPSHQVSDAKPINIRILLFTKEGVRVDIFLLFTLLIVNDLKQLV